MKHEIPMGNWTAHLADKIADAADGDTIVCHNEFMKIMGERACARFCPDKTILFEVATLRLI
jgi:hypothetical protein